MIAYDYFLQLIMILNDVYQEDLMDDQDCEYTYLPLSLSLSLSISLYVYIYIYIERERLCL